MTRIKRAGLRTFVLLAAAAAVITACGPKNSPEPFGGSKAPNEAAAKAMEGAPEAVQAIYKQRCISCHGQGLEGKVGPTTNLQQIGGKLTKEQIVKQIQNGGNGMPGFQGKLTPEETEAVAGWLAAKK